MLIDFGSGGPDQLQADVAVIGAGAAGITMAKRLIEGGCSVVLLESGGFDFEPLASSFNAGTTAGQPYYELEWSRLRFFGGTTAIWGGRCAELDPIDLERREWVEHSGWPIGMDELQLWYCKARPLLGLPAKRRVNGSGPGFLAGLSAEELAVRHWEFDHEFDRFGMHKNRELIDHPRLTVATHATVRELVAAPSGRGIEWLDVRGPDGRRVRVQAKSYVVAAGGIENSRLLLVSNSVMKAGLGNTHDLVGRYFMEHPHARGGAVVGASAWRVLSAFRNRRFEGVPVAPLLTPSAGLQREQGLLNSAVTIAARPPADGAHSLLKKAYLKAKHEIDPTRGARGVWKVQRLAGRQLKQVAGPLIPWWSCVAGDNELTLVLRAEQAPNRESRVTLTDELDALGAPRVQLDWRLLPQDIDSAAGLVAALAREFARQGIGKVERSRWLEDEAREWVSDSLVSAHPLGGYHHMGTTRMADDPKQGVTDGYGRVHGIDNLYIAGSSLFPTGGWANPTLTILALTLRTTDHMLSKMA